MTETYTAKVRPEKVAAVEAIRAELEASAAAVVTEYRGLTVEELKLLRARLSEQDTSYRVTKNTLALRAANALGLGELESVLEGPVAVAYVKGDPVAAAKIIATFAKEHPALVIKAGVLDGRIMSDQQTKDLATVDPLDVSRAKIAGLLTAPLQQLMMLLEAPAGRILYVLEELGKREGEPAPAAEPSPEAPDVTPPEPEAPSAADVQAQPEPEAEAAPPAEPEPQAEAEQAEGLAEAPAEAEPAAEAPAEAEPAAEVAAEETSTDEPKEGE